MIAPAAELKGVSKSFGRGRTRVQALRGVDLQIFPGQLTLIEGPSGSGKTTLLHILGLLQPSDGGEVWIDGRRLDHLPESTLTESRRRHIVLIFQNQNLLESLTVRDNVALAERLRYDSRDPVPIDDYLRRVRLDGRAGHIPRQLSGGEKQRTAIARALACQGRLILADEPTANLDWENARQVVESLTELAHRDGRAVVVVTHDSRLVPFADRIVQLVDGRVPDSRRTDANADDASEPEGPPPPQPPEAPRRRGSAWGPWLGLIALIAVGGWLAVRYLEPTAPSATQPDEPTSVPSDPRVVAAAAAVVEPVSRTIVLRGERPGRIVTIYKQAGEPIRAGEPLIEIDGGVAQALVEQKRAALRLAEANLADLRAWDRPEKRGQAEARVERESARVERAERELERIESLDQRNVASRTELDHAREESRLAAAALVEAKYALAISTAGPTAEQLAVAEAHVAEAKAALQLARTDLERYTIKSPIDGHVVYRHLEPGEVVDPEAPAPILSVANLDRLRLRAEVDEADIGRVFVGQPVLATAEAYEDREFTGRVVRFEPMMGRKNVRTERATEQLDTKVREVLIDFDDPPNDLPIDLQMTVRFLADDTLGSNSERGLQPD